TEAMLSSVPMLRLRASGEPSPTDVPARVEPRRPMAPVAKRMLSSRDVLPERYGPHSATTRCAPLPGLPPVMVSVFGLAMTTSSFFASHVRRSPGRRRSHRTQAAGANSLSREMLSPCIGRVNAAAGERIVSAETEPARASGRRRQELVDGVDPRFAGIVVRQTVLLAHALPAFEAGEFVERAQDRGPLRVLQRREFDGIDFLESRPEQAAHHVDATRNLGRLVEADRNHPPYRHPRFAGARADFDLELDARLPIGSDLVAGRRGAALRQHVIEGCGGETLAIGEMGEHRTLGQARLLGHLLAGRKVALLAQQLEIGFDDRLARAHAALATTVDAFRR